MELYQFIILMCSLAAGFGWLIHQNADLNKRLASLETRVAIIETILLMMGYPSKGHIQERRDS